MTITKLAPPQTGTRRPLGGHRKHAANRKGTSTPVTAPSSSQGSNQTDACPGATGPQPLEAWARDTLAMMRAQIQSDLRAIATSELESPQTGGDEADQSTACAEQDARIASRVALIRRLAQVDAALGRLHRGEYGICESTGEPIPEARLRANPLATCTLEAQNAIERRQRQYAT